MAIVAAAIALYRMAPVILLVAAAIVVAVVIRLLADPLHHRLGVGRKLAVALSVLIILSIVGGAAFFFGARVAGQVNNLLDQLPAAIESVRQALASGPVGRTLQGMLDSGSADAGSILRNVGRAAGNALTALVYIVVTITGGVIFAIYSAEYRDGALLLLPPKMRPQALAAANASGRALKGLLIGQFISMTIIGLLTSIGLLLIGMPSWLALGLLAGIAQFVPVIGPNLSAIPGLLVAASINPSMFLSALAVYVGVQQLESNFITPLLMRRAASLPMALTIFSIIAFSLLAGALGAILAMPVTLVAYIFTQKLYLEGALGEKLHIPGDR